MKKLNKKGFTLIELIVVIAILAILAAILIPAVTGYITKATESKDAANCRSLYAEASLGLMINKAAGIGASPLTVDAMTVTWADDGSTTEPVLTNFACTHGTWSLDLK